MLHLDDATILDLLDLSSVTARVADAYAAWGRGRAATTQRVRAATDDGMASAMAAVVPPFKGGKIYATRDGRFTFVIVLFDLTGRFLCTLDGDAITRFRTPATCALAVRCLAAPDVQVAAVVGAGRQAWQHLAMLRAELPLLAEVRVHARRSDAAELLVKHAVDQGIPAVVAPSAAGAVDGAEVVVTVTSASDPLFPAEVVGDRTLLCAVGSTKYDRSEIDPEVVGRCVAVVADDLSGSRHECGDLIRAEAAGRFSWDRAVELHALVAGTVAVPRAGAGPVLFETQGAALQDVAAAGLAWQRYQPPTTREL
jgi:ornithine cyclodeaminase/alanine dehydrogenase-like protein (mu-crystallin family)